MTSVLTTFPERDAVDDDGGISIPRCRPLLAAYQQVLEDAPPPPRFIVERRSKRWFPPYLRVTFRPAVRFFIRHHIFRSLTALARAYQRRAALLVIERSRSEEAALLKQFDDELALIERYKQSLGTKRPAKVLGAGFLVVAFYTTLVLVTAVPFPGRDRTLPLLENVSDSLLPPNPARLWKAAVEAAPPEARAGTVGQPASPGLDKADLEVIGGALLAFGSALYVILRVLPIGAFTLKRLAFNLHPSPVSRRPPGTKSQHDGRVTGLYEHERALFAELRAQPPREIPFDLLRSTIMVLPVCVALLVLMVVVLIETAVTQPTALGSYDGTWIASITSTSLLCLVAVLRLVHLLTVWKRRGGGRTEADPWVAAWVQTRTPPLCGAALGSLVGLGWITSAMTPSEELTAPAHWAALSLALTTIGVLAVGFGRLAAARRQDRDYLRPTCRTIGYAMVAAGMAGVVGLHDWTVTALTLAATVVAIVLIERLEIVSRGRSRRRPLLIIPSVGLLALSLPGIAMWSSVEPIGTFPTAEEAALLQLLPTDVRPRCERSPGWPLYDDAIEIRCRVSENVDVYAHRFPSGRASAAAYDSYVKDMHLPARSCDPSSNPDFSGSAPLASGEVACFLSDGVPSMEWHRPDQRLYAYTHVVSEVVDGPELRQEVVAAWGAVTAP